MPHYKDSHCRLPDLSRGMTSETFHHASFNNQTFCHIAHLMIHFAKANFSTTRVYKITNIRTTGCENALSSKKKRQPQDWVCFTREHGLWSPAVPSMNLCSGIGYGLDQVDSVLSDSDFLSNN